MFKTGQVVAQAPARSARNRPPGRGQGRYGVTPTMSIAAFSPYAALRRDGALPCLDRAGSERGHAGGRVGVGGGVPRGLPREVLGQSPNMIQTSRLAIRPSHECDELAAHLTGCVRASQPRRDGSRRCWSTSSGGQHWPDMQPSSVPGARLVIRQQPRRRRSSCSVARLRAPTKPWSALGPSQVAFDRRPGAIGVSTDVDKCSSSLPDLDVNARRSSAQSPRIIHRLVSSPASSATMPLQDVRNGIGVSVRLDARSWSTRTLFSAAKTRTAAVSVQQVFLPPLLTTSSQLGPRMVRASSASSAPSSPAWNMRMVTVSRGIPP